jgi:integrase
MQMETDYSISIYLDTRREKANGLYPVKLRVYSSSFSKTKLYPTVFNLTKQDFEKAWETVKPRKEYHELRLKIQSVENKADEVASELSVFSFDQFEKKLFRKSGKGEDVFYHYLQTIERFRSNYQFGTASNYSLSMKSLKQFVKFKKGKEPKRLSFIEINKDWLYKYESYMIDEMNRSRTTVSMYLRALRTIFNNAIQENEISIDHYPFGEKKYQIPAVKKVKKALSKEQLKTLFEAKPKTPQQEKAKDFWFFSFACNGMNIKDIALLRWENLQDDKLIFYRAKTLNTSRKSLSPVIVYLTEYSRSIIEKYSNNTSKPKDLIFNIVSNEMSKEQQQTAYKNFTRFINQNFKKLAIDSGISENISTYWARHSFATSAIRKGASIEFVSEALSHSNIKTTQGYFAGFEESSKRELMNTIMDF